MMRRRSLHKIGLAALLVTTVPALALLCRGHTPSRFATANLPFWQRVLPSPVRLAIVLRCPPAAPGTVQYTKLHLQNITEDRLLAALEHPAARPSTLSDAGQAGKWLLAACALGRNDPALAREQDEVATRLMNTQDSDGYLAAGVGASRWSPAQTAAFRENLCGLLAYYHISHSPASIYAAMQAGDLVTSDTEFAQQNKPTPDGLLLPMARLYQATGEPRYKEWVLHTAQGNTSDGVGLCAVYEMTGRGVYLQRARQIWREQANSPAADTKLAAALWTITGASQYLPSIGSAPAPWLCPLTEGTLTYSRIPGGIAVNGYTNSTARFGTVSLTQRLTAAGQTRAATLTITAPRPTAFTLRLYLPRSSGKGNIPSRLFVNVNGKPLKITDSQRTFETITRRWKSGDTVALALGSI